MAERKPAPEDLNLDFTLVTDPYHSPSQTRRRVAGADVAPTGYAQTNVNGTGEVDKLVTLMGGKKEDQFLMSFGANEEHGVVAGYLAREGDPGAATVKRAKKNKAIFFHLGHIFDKYPMLRPAGDTFCTLKLGKDKKGTPCIIINLRGTATRKGRSSGSDAAEAK